MHGSDYVTLYNSFASENLLATLMDKIQGIIDFQEALQTDEEFLYKYNCSTSLSKSSPHKNKLYETVCNKQPDKTKAHDALYDATVLKEIYWMYMHKFYMYSFKHFHYENAREPAVILNIVKASVAKSMRKKKNNKNGVKTFYGFQ